MTGWCSPRTVGIPVELTWVDASTLLVTFDCRSCGDERIGTPLIIKREASGVAIEHRYSDRLRKALGR